MKINWDDQSEALKVARSIHWLAAHDAPAAWVSPKKLQKLLYYVQGWSMALRGRPAFTERIKAWTQGPVVPKVWHDNKLAEFRSVARAAATPPVSTDELAFIASIWEQYKQFDGDQLEAMTHEEPPWKDTYKPDEQGRCELEITRTSMSSFFSSIAPSNLTNSDLLRMSRDNRPPASWYEEAT